MKITVTKEHYKEACRRVKARTQADDEDRPFYGQCCLIAVAAEDAGIDVDYVNTTLIRTKRRTYFNLPMKGRMLLSAFDALFDDKSKGGPPEEFPVILPAEFDIEDERGDVF